MPIDVLLVDDQTLVREGIKSLLNLDHRIRVCAEARDGKEALAQLQSRPVDVVLLDIRMPVMSGLEFLKAANEQQLVHNTLVLTTFDEHELVLECLKLGAKGYLKKDVSLSTLINAIESLANGKSWMQPALTERVKSRVQSDTQAHEPITESLTERELQVLQLVAGGYSNHEIASATFRSEGTVRNQVSSILAKLNVKDRTRAVLKAMDLGLL
ncbi:response regulator [Gilvimarinus algae]|uniref:Response regulator transcription factor n=1 Tax=Gilvimarinus algae TaxID=3058037 RepID=A0ABT8T9G2_9GAMM|nr:response regulator transcription factor [Gilvimarinus sp. SDUM040014]MDO3380764.1 response regulator transcription factor [Gilvimarinus sp. SDUM040014]